MKESAAWQDWIDTMTEGFERRRNSADSLREVKEHFVFRRWPFLTVDYHAAEHWLSEMETKGFRLVRVGKAAEFPSIATFRKGNPLQGTRYCIDFVRAAVLFPEDQKKFRDYIELCDAAGWEYVCNGPTESMRIFRSEDGIEEPIPLQTDLDTEREGLKSGFWENDGKIAVTYLILSVILGFFFYKVWGASAIFMPNWSAVSDVLYHIMFWVFLLIDGVLPGAVLLDYARVIHGKRKVGNDADWEAKKRKGLLCNWLIPMGFNLVILLNLAAVIFKSEANTTIGTVSIITVLFIIIISAKDVRSAVCQRVWLLNSKEKRTRYKRMILLADCCLLAVVLILTVHLLS